MAWSLCSFSQSPLTHSTRSPKVDRVISFIGMPMGTLTLDAVSPFTMATTWILWTWWHPMQRKQGRGWQGSGTWWQASVMRTHWPKDKEPTTNILYISRAGWMGGGMKALLYWLVQQGGISSVKILNLWSPSCVIPHTSLKLQLLNCMLGLYYASLETLEPYLWLRYIPKIKYNQSWNVCNFKIYITTYNGKCPTITVRRQAHIKSQRLYSQWNV